MSSPHTQPTPVQREFAPVLSAWLFCKSNIDNQWKYVQLLGSFSAAADELGDGQGVRLVAELPASSSVLGGQSFSDGLCAVQLVREEVDKESLREQRVKVAEFIAKNQVRFLFCTFFDIFILIFLFFFCLFAS